MVERIQGRVAAVRSLLALPPPRLRMVRALSYSVSISIHHALRDPPTGPTRPVDAWRRAEHSRRCVHAGVAHLHSPVSGSSELHVYGALRFLYLVT